MERQTMFKNTLYDGVDLSIIQPHDGKAYSPAVIKNWCRYVSSGQGNYSETDKYEVMDFLFRYFVNNISKLNSSATYFIRRNHETRELYLCKNTRYLNSETEPIKRFNLHVESHEKINSLLELSMTDSDFRKIKSVLDNLGLDFEYEVEGGNSNGWNKRRYFHK